jgi:CubicO group peptidase (beta-lactamase class C family)
MTRRYETEIHGRVEPKWEPVRDAFAENFARRGELGGACCIYLRGEKVVDLWGGIRDSATGAPWEEDTMVVVHSTTKGLSAMTLALAHSRGLLDYEERVATYWPEFAQNGKAAVTVRQLLAHQAGLHAFDEPIDRGVIADPDRFAAIMARQKPAWPPGERQAYHAISLGFYQSELLRRVDPQRRTLGRFFQDEIATPLGLDFYIRLPESIPNARLARMTYKPALLRLLDLPVRMQLAMFNPSSPAYRAMAVNPGTTIYSDSERVYARNFEVPSGGGVGTARAIARAYSAFTTGGDALSLRPETLRLLMAPAVPPARGFYDECLKTEIEFSLGFAKPNRRWPLGQASGFGSPGAGGSLGFADPERGVAYAYVTNKMGASLPNDPREEALRRALTSVVGP